jgi:PPOX class probable FMN-dependent enzyme
VNKAQQEFGAPSERVKAKVRDYLCEATQDFIRSSPFVIIATSNSEGHCDASPKGGTPGFVKVLNEKQLLLPDIAGNRLFQSFENLESNGRAGLVFFIPGCDVTFRVNGRATKVSQQDDALLGIAVETFFEDDNTRVLQGLLVEVEEAYIHCPRAFLFAGIWDASTIETNQKNKVTKYWGNRWRATFE